MLAITLNFHNLTLFSIQSRRSCCCSPPPPQPMAPYPRPPRWRAPPPPYIDKDNDEGRMIARRDTGNGEGGDPFAGNRHTDARATKSRRGAPDKSLLPMALRSRRRQDRRHDAMIDVRRRGEGKGRRRRVVAKAATAGWG